MESIINRIFLHNWQRKLVALLTAIIVWLFVNHSIYETRTISNVPIRIINLPQDKTIIGLLPNGILSRRISLTLTGTKDVVDEIEPGDLEVLLDASTADSDDWLVQVTKKNLISLNANLDLSRHISQVEHTTFVIKMSKLVSAKIPVTILTPTGQAPPGYDYLDIWPEQLFQVVNGPTEDIQQLKESGLELTLDLNEITKSDLDDLKSIINNDEVTYYVPKKWKLVHIPFRQANEELNDPEALNMHIDFLRKEFLPLDIEMPIRIYFPLSDIEKLNPQTISLAVQGDIQKKFGITTFNKPLFAKDVSRLFIEIVRNAIELNIIATTKPSLKGLPWSIEFINPHELEDNYVTQSIKNASNSKAQPIILSKAHEDMLRRRFREYMQRLTLYLPNGKKLYLKSTIEGDQIRVMAN